MTVVMQVSSRSFRTQTVSSAFAVTSLPHWTGCTRKSTHRKAESFLMEQTATSSTADLAMPTITYAGRLSDPRKGFDLFLDGLEIFWSVTPAPEIAIWVIGGEAPGKPRTKTFGRATPPPNAQT